MSSNNTTITSLDTPKNITTVKTISGYNITEISVILNTSATVTVWLFDADGNFISAKPFVMSGTDYSNWTNNDMPYVLNWVELQISNMTTL